jgi:hypothetical protein
LKIYPQPYEDSIVAIVRKSPGTDVAAPVQVDISQACLFASQFPAQKAAVHSFIKEHAAGGVLLFGAGHLATTFVHMHEIQDFIEYAVDDQPEKAGKVLPGTRIPIEPSSRLGSTQAALCLLALNPANEERVVTRFAEFAARGGRFMSLFPVSSRRLPVIGTCL